MGLKTKPPEGGDQSPRSEVPAMPKPTAPSPTTGTGPNNNDFTRISENVERRLNPYIAANPEDYQGYTRLVAENPERAARTLMLRDLQAVEREVSLKKNEIAGAERWFEQQSDDVKGFIRQQLADTTHPLQRQLALRSIVLGRMRIEDSQRLSAMAKTGSPAMSAA